MKIKLVRSWEDLEALPEGKWVEVQEGMDVTFSDQTTSGGGHARVEIALKPRLARSLQPGKGEVLEAAVRGNRLVLARRKARRTAPRTSRAR